MQNEIYGRKYFGEAKKKQRRAALCIYLTKTALWSGQFHVIVNCRLGEFQNEVGRGENLAVLAVEVRRAPARVLFVNFIVVELLLGLVGLGYSQSFRHALPVIATRVPVARRIDLRAIEAFQSLRTQAPEAASRGRQGPQVDALGIFVARQVVTGAQVASPADHSGRTVAHKALGGAHAFARFARVVRAEVLANLAEIAGEAGCAVTDQLVLGLDARAAVVANAHCARVHFIFAEFSGELGWTVAREARGAQLLAATFVLTRRGGA